MSTDTIEPDPFDAIVDAPFDSALSERYLVYALSTITARSLPDLRDGLKLQARRLGARWPRVFGSRSHWRIPAATQRLVMQRRLVAAGVKV